MNVFSKKSWVIGIAIGLMIGSCQKDLLEKDSENLTKNSWDVVPLGAITDMPGRTLAANCFQCHGTNGYAGELKIAGQSASGIISKFDSYRTKNPRSNIMYTHAYGYTPEEINLIAQFIAKQ